MSDRYENLAKRLLIKYKDRTRRGKTKNPNLSIKLEETVQKHLDKAIREDSIHNINIARRALNILKRKDKP